MIVLIKSKKALVPTAVVLLFLIVFSVMWYFVFSYFLDIKSLDGIEKKEEGIESTQPYDFLNSIINFKLKCEDDNYPLYFAPFYCNDYTIENYIDSENKISILGICSYKLEKGSYNLVKSLLQEGVKEKICESEKNIFVIDKEEIDVDLNDKDANYVYQFDFITINNKYLRTKIIIKNDE